MTPSTAFDAVEADFFAREADLYKQEDVESFDDLDRGGTRRPGAARAAQTRRSIEGPAAQPPRHSSSMRPIGLARRSVMAPDFVPPKALGVRRGRRSESRTSW